MSVVGIDIGFGFTKATNGRDSVVFKSVFGEAADIPFRERLLDPAKVDDHLHVELDDRGYFIGELAERQSLVRYFTLDQNQFVANFVRTFALAALARLAERNVPVNVVTGLPVGYYRQHKEEMAELLTGRHTVMLVDRNGIKQETVVSVNKVKVIPQPFGSMFNMMLNDLGEAGDRRFIQEKIGIVDIGFRTADYTVSNRTHYLARGSRTTDSGISHAFKVIAAKLQERSGVDVELYRLYEAVERGSIKIRGKSYDIKKLTDQVFGQLASSIANEVNQLWSDDWDIDTIVLSGGGGAVLTPYLKPLVHGEIMPQETGVDARFNNVRGYWKYAKYLWERGRESSVNLPRTGTST